MTQNILHFLTFWYTSFKLDLPFSLWNGILYNPERARSTSITQTSAYQRSAFLFSSRRVYSSHWLGLTRILIKHYTQTISRCIYGRAVPFNWYLCGEDCALLAYAAGSDRRVERRRQDKKPTMRKSHPFTRGKKRSQSKQVEAPCSVVLESAGWRLALRRVMKW